MMLCEDVIVRTESATYTTCYCLIAVQFPTAKILPTQFKMKRILDNHG